MTSKFAALSLEVEKPGRMIIRHPGTQAPLVDGEGREGWIEVFSSDSDVANRQRRAVQNRRMDDFRNKRRPTVEEAEADGLDLLAAITAGWYLVGPDGAVLDVPFSRDAARELYASAGTAWLRDQVDIFAGDRANFVKASSPN